MADKPSYLDYVQDHAHMQEFRRYQSRYAEKMRESDRVLIELVRERLGAGPGAGKSLLDVGCSSGNLLGHIKRRLPDLQLHGADLAASIIEQNRTNPDLDGVEFTVMDMLAFSEMRVFDIVVANASLMFFDGEEFVRAVGNIARAVKPGGAFIAFDFFHPFDQEIAITETSALHPDGLSFQFRSYRTARAALGTAGVADVEFRPFHMPFDLPRSDDPANINSYTTATPEGRLSFRGALCQPWCHLVARKPLTDDAS